MKKIPITFALFACFFPAAYSQETVPSEENDKRNYQLEFLGGTYRRGYNSRNYLLGAGINVPGRNTNWYTNYAVQFTHQGSFSPYQSDFITLSAGKHYQWTKGDFYASLGVNVGGFVNYSGITDRAGAGLALIPKMEIGVNAQKVIMAVGVNTTIGYGYFNGQSSPAYKSQFELTGTFSPYLKIILK